MAFFQVLGDLSIANSALFPSLSVCEGPELEVESPLHPNSQAHILLLFGFKHFLSPDFGIFLNLIICNVMVV